MRLLTYILLTFFAIPAFGDTLTTRDNVSVNGKLIEMKEGVVRLETHSPKGTETRYIMVDKIATIEFNSAIYNSATPPKIFGLAPPSRSASVQKSPTPADTVVLRGNERKECKLESITSAAVVCEGKDNEYSRILVIRIQVVPR